MIVVSEHEGHEIYCCHCDHCNNLFEEPHEGFTFRYSEDNLLEDISNNDWKTGDSKYNEGEDGKHYCSECWYSDDNDKFHLHPHRQGLYMD